MTQDAPSAVVALPSPGPTAGDLVATGSATSVPSPGSTPRAISTPVLKPGEVITWIKIERPRLELGEILVGSFVLVGLTAALALFLGVILGYLRSRNTDTHAHGAGRLDLR